MTLCLLADAAAAAPHVGRIVGGWEYVWAAYGIAWGGLTVYALSLWIRLRGAPTKDKP